MRKPYDPRDSLSALAVAAELLPETTGDKLSASPSAQASTAHALRVGVSDLLAHLDKINRNDLPASGRDALSQAQTCATQLARAIHIGLLQATMTTAEVVQPLPDLHRLNILLVETSPRHQIEEMLVQMGAQVFRAENARNVPEISGHQPLHLVIVDIDLDDSPGIEVIRALRNEPSVPPQLPILAVSSFALRGNRAVILAAGATDVLRKPLRSLPFLAAEVIRLTTEPALAPSMALPELDRLCALAGAQMQQDLLFHLGQDLLNTESGLIAASAGAPDWKALRAHSHVLIALAGTLGARAMQAAAQRLNAAAHDSDIALTRHLCDEVAVMMDLAIVQVALRGAEAPAAVEVSAQ